MVGRSRAATGLSERSESRFGLRMRIASAVVLTGEVMTTKNFWTRWPLELNRRCERATAWSRSASKVLRSAIVFLLTLLAFSLPPPSSSYAATLTVCTSCGYTTIAAAISAASAGDTISVTDAVHTEYNITVDRNLTIDGLGATNTTVDGNNLGSVFIINGGVTATIQDMTIRNGQPLTYQASGGGILNYGTLTLSNSTIAGNGAGNNGGGIYNYGGTVTISNSTIFGNSAAFGGGIANVAGGTLTITDSTLSGNSTYEYDGGGIFNYNSTATISNSTISGNSAVYGGGILDDGQLTISNSTISANSAVGGGDGGGIFKTNAYGGPLTISFSTIAGNSASRHGGGIVNLSPATVKNSIVGNNSGGDCYFNYPMTALGANLDTDGSCVSTNFTQVASTQLALGTLALNAPGTTETLALLPGSVATDAATDCTDAFGVAVTTDQRGVGRPDAGESACDIGAYEFADSPPLGPVGAWVGLKNSDDQGTQFDVRAEVYRNATLVATGQTLCVTGITRNAAKATNVSIPIDAITSTDFNSGDTLSLRILTRIGTNPDGSKCAGPGGSHSSAVGLRLYYDAVSRASHMGDTVTGIPADLFLHSNGNACVNAPSTGVTNRFLDGTTPGASAAKCQDSGSVNFAGGNPWSAVSSWSLALP